MSGKDFADANIWGEACEDGGEYRESVNLFCVPILQNGFNANFMKLFNINIIQLRSSDQRLSGLLGEEFSDCLMIKVD